MITRLKTYKTDLTQNKINEWIESIESEKIGFSVLKTNKFIVEKNNEIFRIQKKRTNKQQPFHAQITGQFNSSNKTIEIKIQQSLYGTIFFSIFWIGLIISPFFADNSFEALGSSIFFLLILIPLTYFGLINSVYTNEAWIINELNLNSEYEVTEKNNTLKKQMPNNG